MNTECLIATLPSCHEDERLAVVLVQSDQGGRISLRQQSWAQGIGWYDQKTLEMEPAQLRQLRSVLGMGGGTTARRPEPDDQPAILAFPGLARTESA
jgi:hypothetical protein